MIWSSIRLANITKTQKWASMQQPAPEPLSRSLSNGSKNYSNNSTLKYSPLRNRSLGVANTRINVRLSCKGSESKINKWRNKSNNTGRKSRNWGLLSCGRRSQLSKWNLWLTSNYRIGRWLFPATASLITSNSECRNWKPQSQASRSPLQTVEKRRSSWRPS